jgi:hypothetical protein
MMMGSIEAEALLWKESLAVEGLHNTFVDDLDSQIAVDMHSLDLDIGTAIETTAVGSDESSFDFFSYQSTVSSRSRKMMRTSTTLKKSLNDLLNKQLKRVAHFYFGLNYEDFWDSIGNLRKYNNKRKYIPGIHKILKF